MVNLTNKFIQLICLTHYTALQKTCPQHTNCSTAVHAHCNNNFPEFETMVHQCSLNHTTRVINELSIRLFVLTDYCMLNVCLLGRHYVMPGPFDSSVSHVYVRANCTYARLELTSWIIWGIMYRVQHPKG